MYNLKEKKYSLFLIVVLSSLVILSIPLIAEKFLDDEHALHIAIHEAGFVLAGFLTIMTIISYSKTKISRMLFSAGAFGILTVGQAAYMYTKMDYHQVEDLLNGSEILDMCILVMTILFAIGVFYKR